MTNQILNRNKIYEEIKTILTNFKTNKNNPLFKKGIYLYGNPGIGKTEFIVNLLKDINYDIVKYDGGDVRNKSIIEMITKHNMSDTNVLSLLTKQKKQICIIMDEIDGMNNGDKGGINTLIKLIRPKKTKKQKTEESTLNPVICIGNYHIDKKITELMKVCNVFELKTPTNEQINQLLIQNQIILTKDINEKIIQYISGDLRKYKSILTIYEKHNNLLKSDLMISIFKSKIYNDDAKKITESLLNNSYELEQHNVLMNETDRTIVGLLLHENIVDIIQKIKDPSGIVLYKKILNKICNADYIDRITFQKQIWLFNEMSSLIKTMNVNKILHDCYPKKINHHPSEIRFTKVLTKYSTEYNNSLFIQNLCSLLSLDKNDLFTFFIHMRNTMSEEEIIQEMDHYEISKLDINRFYRLIDNYTQKEENNDETDSVISN